MIGARVLPPIAGSPMAGARFALASLAACREPCGQPDFVGRAGAVDRLQDQFEIERLLQFADNADRRIVADHAQEVAAPAPALTEKPELFKEAFDGKIQRVFQGQAPAAEPRLTCK